MRRLLCRMLGHRWNYCCRYAYQAGHLWCERCKALHRPPEGPVAELSREDAERQARETYQP